ncbi:MAG: homocysteine S-methyltransferase family protein [Proteobacteria bacterium]|nr:homocysteine S-methyltransferase family protein [Pseudomonadota bacterium]
MAKYKDLQQRIDRGEVIILDGAVGTQLQEMGVPMDNTAWAAMALQTHPFTVRHMHEQYIKAGADVITTNSYSAARHNLDPLGLGDLTVELNLRAAILARQARETAAGGRDVLIGGSVSNFGMIMGGEGGRSLHRLAKRRSLFTEEQLKANLREQAETLAEAGVDFFLVEGTGSNTHRKWIIEACKATGLPLWVGFKCRRDPDEKVVRTGYRSADAFGEVISDVMSQGGSVLSIFHSSVSDTNAALKIALKKWSGPIGLYPDAERIDYITPAHDHTVKNKIGPDAFLKHAHRWVEAGAQIIGGCCGYGLPYIRLLRDGLPAKIAKPRRLAPSRESGRAAA